MKLTFGTTEPPYYLRYIRLRSMKFFCEAPLRNFASAVLLPDVEHLGVRERGVNVSLSRSPSALPSPLRNAVPVVVGIRTEEKMIGSTARNIIAGVANVKRSNRAILSEHPCDPVRADGLSFELKVSVPCGAFTRHPDPAFSKLRAMLRNGSVAINFIPKPICVFFSHASDSIPHKSQGVN